MITRRKSRIAPFVASCYVLRLDLPDVPINSVLRIASALSLFGHSTLSAKRSISLSVISRSRRSFHLVDFEENISAALMFFARIDLSLKASNCFFSFVAVLCSGVLNLFLMGEKRLLVVSDVESSTSMVPVWLSSSDCVSTDVP